MKKRAICLSRVSTQQQELESQTAQIIAAAKADGYDDIIVIENKESAVKKDEAHLLGIVEMKQYIEDGGIDAVYCFEISRLSRKPRDLYAIRDYLLDHGVQLVVLTPYFKLLDANGMLDATASVVFALFGSFAEQENVLRTERCKRGKRKKIEAGLFSGGKCPMGYDRDKNDRFIIKPDEAEAVRRIFMDYLAGKSKLAIARDLRSEGYLQNFQTAQYAHTHINNVLHNADYTGLHGRPAIISRETFERVQERLNQPRAVKRKVYRVALAASKMINPKSKCPKNKYYVNTRACTYYCILDKEETRKKFISLRGLDAYLWYAIKQEYAKVRENDDETRTLRYRAAMIEKRVRHMQIEIAKCDDKVDKVEERLIMGKINDTKAHAMEVKIEADKRRMMAELEELQREFDVIVESQFKIENPDKLGDEGRMNLASRLIEHIELVPVSEHRGALKWYCKIFWSSGRVENTTIDSYHWKYYDEAGNEIPVGHYRGKDIDEIERAHIARTKSYPRHKNKVAV